MRARVVEALLLNIAAICKLIVLVRRYLGKWGAPYMISKLHD